QYGLVPTITFFLSKIDDEKSRNAFSSGLKYFSGKDTGNSNKYAVINDGVNSRGKGYASYLSLVLIWPLGDIMKQYQEIENLSGYSLISNQRDDPRNVLLRGLGTLEKYAPKIEILSLPALLELKKILRALS
ncbi:MAG: hypothetical protein ACP5LW_06230, partial [Nitrososphaeria archaeon]